MSKTARVCKTLADFPYDKSKTCRIKYILGGFCMKKGILCMVLLILVLNTRIYVEDWKIIEHFDTNEFCVSLFDKYDLFISAKGVDFYIEN